MFTPLTPVQRKRLLNNLLKSCDDPSKLTTATICWICQNAWWLSCNGEKPYIGDDGKLEYPRRPETREQLKKIRATFNVFEHFCSDVDLNHALGWVNKWVNDKSEYSREALASFRERCEITQEFRRLIGVGTYRIKFYKIDWKNKRTKYQCNYAARSLTEAAKLWRANHRISPNHWDDKWHIYQIHKVADTYYYYIYRDYLCAETYDYLTKPLDFFTKME